MDLSRIYPEVIVRPMRIEYINKGERREKEQVHFLN